MEIILSILIGYALGCINPAYFFAKAKGFDIRREQNQQVHQMRKLLWDGNME